MIKKSLKINKLKILKIVLKELAQRIAWITEMWK